MCPDELCIHRVHLAPAVASFMELSLVPVLLVFVLFAVSGAAFFVARRSGVPHSVILVAIGVLLTALSHIPTLSFLGSLELTPELLFYIFLPTLIFESAYAISIRRLTQDAVPVALLSIVSLLISALTIAAGLYYFLPLVGFPIPFVVAFLFGSLISATDPVAVLALFKEYGAPRRLALLFEGESLFNDATGFALFLIALEFALKGGFASDTALEGVVSFTVMMLGGALFGLIIGGVFSKMIGWARSSESVAITLTIVLAHVTFLLSEFISHHAHIGGFEIHLSAITATTVAAMVLGNYGRTKMPLRAEEFVEKFWGQMAFLANSIIFILIGMLASSLPFSSPELFVPIFIAVIVVAFARALSIYPVVGGWNRFAEEARRIPRAWQHLLAWGSLRGALAVTMALLIPASLTLPGWEHAMPISEALLAFTTGCIFVTLFFKATTIGPLMQYLKVGRLSEIETAEYDEARALVYARVLERLARFSEKNYIPESVYTSLRNHYEKRLQESSAECAKVGAQEKLAEAALRVWVLGIEKESLKDLLLHGEVSERVYKRIANKLTIRTEDAERHLNSSEIHITPGEDIIERVAGWIRTMLYGAPTEAARIADEYTYYRALIIIAHKVEKEIARIKAARHHGIFSAAAVARTEEIYARFKADARAKMDAAEKKDPAITRALSERLAHCGVLKVEEHVLDELLEHEMITPKVRAALEEELERDIRALA